MRRKTHSRADRGADAYFTPPVGILSLLHLEEGKIPQVVLEPACGDGAIVLPMRAAGFRVIACDLMERRCPDMTAGLDFLAADGITSAPAIVTNPPYGIGTKFMRRCVEIAPYVAALLPINFLAGINRRPWHETSPLARVWVASRRLPMMHREGWDGPKASSSMDTGWFIWSREHRGAPAIRFYDWLEICGDGPMACDASATRDRAHQIGGSDELVDVEADLVVTTG
ncbi:hypothetical protein [uncultured Alsobacter sp.]|uniref:hypothetical protein n=1 Tax=uncultured Alsobacter sp. TaxID=1748258 RepID=UPI0025D49E54|nr:hypothetical protein [uncultured Alsobacter sp.]